MSPTQPIGWVSWHAAIPICSFYGRSGYDRRLDHKSRMKRELPVRIREGLGVQFPRATRLVVFCHTKEDAEQVRAKLTTWLAERGLTFSEEKTRIVNLDAGFDFLGFNVRQYKVTTSRSGARLLTRPSKKSVQAIKRKIKGIFQKCHGQAVAVLIRNLNPVIRGWTNYFRVGVSARIFEKLDDYCFKFQKRWVRRQHPTKSWTWLVKRYWSNHRQNDRWVFGNKNLHLLKFAWTPIQRHIMVRRFASWDDPELQDYWDNRKVREFEIWLTAFMRKVAKQQDYVCPVCKDHLANGEEIHSHHLVRKSKGGGNQPGNFALLHYYCHQAETSKERAEERS